MTALLSERPRIARVRVHTARRDALQVSLRAGALVDRLDFRPPGLSPASILLVRALRDPIPGCVSLARPAEGAPARWQQAVTAKLARVAQEAVRPARGPVPASAAAVLFADEAELVACLVRDWLRGHVADRWWWKNVLGDLTAPEWLRRHVLARGELMVPAVAVLAAGWDATAWISKLEDAAAEAAVTAVVRCHALPPALASNSMRPSGSGRHAREQPALESLFAAVPEVNARDLRPAQRRLLVLALAIARAPAWVRTPQFEHALQVLDRAGTSADERRALPELNREEGVRVSRATPTIIAESASDTPAGHFLSQPASVDRTARAPFGHAQGVARGHPDIAHSDVPGSSRNVPAAVPEDAAEARATRAGTLPTPAPAPKSVTLTAPALERGTRVPTQFGGIFYLLNAALAMGLYSDFTAPRGANLRLSPWDWLALIGRAWFGREFVRDPAWKLLADLAGRERRYLRRPRWLKAQIEALLQRLALALGEERCAAIPALVCRYRGEVTVTASRLDVHLALAELPLALRIAGLDRDPGWVPAAGRSIAFHFE